MILTVQIEKRELAQTLGEFPRRLRRGIERGLTRATARLQAAVAALAQSPLGVRAAGGLGELAGSVAREVAEQGGRLVGRVFLAPPADRYGLFVEVGTRPHWPPPGALEGWVWRRLGISGNREAREVAFRVGRKIARLGTPGRFYFERALRDNECRVVAALEEEILQATAHGQ